MTRTERRQQVCIPKTRELLRDRKTSYSGSADERRLLLLRLACRSDAKRS